MRQLVLILLIWVAVPCAGGQLGAADPPAATNDPPPAAAGMAQTDRQALEAIQWVIGEWHGVGQPRRGSRQGAWQEDCAWIWEFDAAGAALAMKSESGKFLQTGKLKIAADAPGEFQLEVPTGHEESQQKQQLFRGKLTEDRRLVLTNSAAAARDPARITLRTVAGGDRLLVLFERRSSADRFTRLAEVGYTRRGSGFGRGGGFVECVVTGGLGTIAVTHEGQTYYVCCSGCRDYFNEDPANVLAEYRARKAQEREEE